MLQVGQAVDPAPDGRCTVTVDGTHIVSCPPGVSVLRAMVAVGASGIPVGCRSGGCGVCRVRIDEGECATGLMSSAALSEADRGNRIVLACQTFPRTDLAITVLGREVPVRPSYWPPTSRHDQSRRSPA